MCIYTYLEKMKKENLQLADQRAWGGLQNVTILKRPPVVSYRNYMLLVRKVIIQKGPQLINIIPTSVFHQRRGLLHELWDTVHA